MLTSIILEECRFTISASAPLLIANHRTYLVLSLSVTRMNFSLTRLLPCSCSVCVRENCDGVNVFVRHFLYFSRPVFRTLTSNPSPSYLSASVHNHFTSTPGSALSVAGVLECGSTSPSPSTRSRSTESCFACSMTYLPPFSNLVFFYLVHVSRLVHARPRFRAAYWGRRSIFVEHFQDFPRTRGDVRCRDETTAKKIYPSNMITLS